MSTPQDDDPDDAARRKAEKDAENEKELAEAKRIESERHEARQAEIEASWTKRVLVEGTGAKAFQGAQARVHIVGRAAIDRRIKSARAEETGFKSGAVIEDSRERGVPVLLLLGRGALVPGLDRVLLSMRAGERAEVVIKPEGGYGAAGSVDHPCVPGSATLTYDVELLAVEREEELWDLSFEAKMALAEERKERGNKLVHAKHPLMADAEYEQALRYLIFNPHPEPEQLLPLQTALVAVHLNLAAVKLRLGREEATIKHAQDALKVQPDTNPKAHYRLGQAYTQLGKYALARDHLARAELAAEGDDASIKGIRAELDRLQKRQERHARDRKKAAARMVRSGSVSDPADEPKLGVVGELLAQARLRLRELTRRLRGEREEGAAANEGAGGGKKGDSGSVYAVAVAALSVLASLGMWVAWEVRRGADDGDAALI